MASDPNPSSQPSLQAMLARLKGMSPQGTADDNTKATAAAKPAAGNGGVAVAAPPAPPKPTAPAGPPAAAAAAKPAAPAPAPAAPPAAAPAAAAAPQACHYCKAPRQGTEEFCMECGAVFSAANAAANSAPATLVKNRYELAELIADRGEVQRFRATDRNHGAAVILVRGPVSLAAEEATPSDVELVPSFDAAGAPSAEVSEAAVAEGPAWPSIAWEKALLENASSASLPRIIEHFTEGAYEYLIEEVPVGDLLWNVWDDPERKTAEKYLVLRQVAEGLHALHQHGKCVIEGLRPDLVTVRADGSGACINDLTDLLPIPLPPNAPIRGTLYSAPELVAARPNTDFRSDLYSFGAMLYALVMGTELGETDFDKKSGLVKNFIARNPDIHPAIGRIVSKTFCRDPLIRFPTDEAGKKDPTGGTELINALEVARKAIPDVRLEIAAWTTTGIVRTGNEDAFMVLHAIQSRQDDLSEYALLLVADGMGGYEAGEIAAELCLQTIREKLIKHPMFTALAGGNHPAPEAFDVEKCKKLLYDTIKEANEVVFTAPQKGIGRRGMGCTVDAVYVDGQNIVVGHVGDSRVYHLKEGRLLQITRDQTLVNRLVELGQISQEDAENHPRKNELQQAVGGRRDVEPAVYSSTMKPGDWILVTSDGLINHIKNDEIMEMFQLEANSAELAARRLVNFANLRGATDNCTVVVARCT
jgi:PPM family protein phosphatase